ncbi:four helix bundle protein [Aquiflexum sp. LQ15W]|uniref:four helix bundle protein n=1 Tax=Cognataquiflexum nitidum TaxID=2922272 RepID=UPI001F132696|nr:four helix bundle protein [Cognataquiflexum nitidum]MCH6201357.1 four helix bundle protein [Cognataquiflexum nitidum]
MGISKFEDLDIWKESKSLCLIIRELTRKKEFAKDFRFASQINSSSGSVMDNIAEGFDREGNREFIQFLSIAKGSNAETRSQAYRALDAGFITQDELEDVLIRTDSIRKKIKSLMIFIKNSEKKGNKFT